MSDADAVMDKMADVWMAVCTAPFSSKNYSTYAESFKSGWQACKKHDPEVLEILKAARFAEREFEIVAPKTFRRMTAWQVLDMALKQWEGDKCAPNPSDSPIATGKLEDFEK